MSNPDNDKTRLIRRPSGSSPAEPPHPAHDSAGDSEQTRYADPKASGGHPQDGSGTRIIERESSHGFQPQTPPPPSYQPDPGTVLVRPSSKPAGTTAGTAAGGVVEKDDFTADGPVVGWLVVVKGPGRGRSVALGYGMNPIGRDAGNRVSIPFGDEEISRKKHAVITYDPRGRKYYLQHGESSNLTYVGETPVLAPTILEGGETIRLGAGTELRFVPLCGADFDWESSE